MRVDDNDKVGLEIRTAFEFVIVCAYGQWGSDLCCGIPRES